MFRSIGKLLKNTRGAFAMQFALLAVPLTICTGLAIDGGRAFLARFELASALDAAALAVGSTLQNQGTDLNAVAAKFVEKNFRTEHTGPIVLNMTSVDDTIVLRGSVKINTYFMPIVGQPTVTVNAESEVRRGGSSLEIALALDITGSMSTSRMNALKKAAKVLVSEVVNDVQTPFFSKIAIVPWSQSINLDLASSPKGFVPAAALDQLRGALIQSKTISAASWRASGSSNRQISQAGWRTVTGQKTITSVDWRWDAAQTATLSIDGSRIRATTGSNHGWSDGQYVRITNASGNYTSLNTNIYQISYLGTKTYQLKNKSNGNFISPPGSGSSTATMQRCYDADCDVAVTTSADLGDVAGSFVNLTGISGTFSSINNSSTTTWVVTPVAGTYTFTLNDSNGPSFSGSASTNGAASECLVADCRYRVTTTAAHGFSTNDNIAMWNITEANSGTSGNNGLNTSWSIENPTGSVFYLPGVGKTYKDWRSTTTGYAAKCALASCNTRITVANSGLNVGDSVEVTGVGGLTGINNPTSSVSSPVAYTSRVLWKVSEKSGNVHTLADTGPGMANMGNDYTSGGASQCLAYGCAKIGYKLSGTDRVWAASPCIVERYGDDRYTDVSPATAPLGINYMSGGTCTRTNYVTPMTSNKTRLNNHINALSTGGNTAGQLGIAWAWYTLSPNFRQVWTAEAENAPADYGTRELAKIAILMTDGEFNTQTCDGLYSSSDCTPHMPSDVPGPSASFRQARKICDAMKAQNIIIYTVGLELNTAQYSDDFLAACATGPQYAFLAANDSELEQAFKDIAVSINRLRISR